MFKEIQKSYMMKSRLLRPSLVSVTKKIEAKVENVKKDEKKNEEKKEKK